MIKGDSTSARKLRTLVTKLDKGLQQSMTEKDIDDHIHKKFRESVATKSQANFTDRKRLSKARVITTEEVVRLRQARETADAEKAAKIRIREEKKKLKELQSQQGMPAPRGRSRGKKLITISEDIIVHSTELGGAAGEVVAEEEWVHIDDFEGEFEDSTPPLSRKRVNKAWNKA